MIEISENLQITAPDRKMLASLDNDATTCGGLYVTFIHPEYATIFREGVLRVMSGIALSRAAFLTLPNDTQLYTTIFGYCHPPFNTPDGEATQIVVPSITKQCLPLIEGDLNQTLHGYHTQLIEETNTILQTLESPYRLASLPSHQV